MVKRFSPIMFMFIMALVVAWSPINAQDAPKTETKPVLSAADVTKLNATLDKDHQVLKLQVQVAARDRDNAVLTFQAVKAAYDKKVDELDKQFAKANDEVEKTRKAIYEAVDVKDADAQFDVVKGEFVAPPTLPPAPPDKK